MDLIILNDGLYSLLSVSKEMMDGIVLTNDVDCFDLCDLVRLNLATFVDSLKAHVMNDDSGYFFGCICN